MVHAAEKNYNQVTNELAQVKQQLVKTPSATTEARAAPCPGYDGGCKDGGKCWTCYDLNFGAPFCDSPTSPGTTCKEYDGGKK